MDKKELRALVRQRKRAMREEEIGRRSQALKQKLIEQELYRSAHTVYGYLSYNQEVRTLPILEQALADGKKVAVPKVYGERMVFLCLDDLTRISPGYCGIPEPIDDGPAAADPTALVLMPGLAFTAQGDRLGYGGGFYDRFLEEEPNHPTVSLCYDFQMFPAIPTQPHDRKVDLVLWA